VEYYKTKFSRKYELLDECGCDTWAIILRSVKQKMNINDDRLKKTGEKQILISSDD